jgi:hypothetical protein
MESRDAVSSLSFAPPQWSIELITDKRSSHNRLCGGYQEILCRSQVRNHHTRRGSSGRVQIEGNVEKS